MAATAGGARSTSSTEGSLRRLAVSVLTIAVPSVAEQEWVDAAATIAGVAHEQVESERGHVVGHRLQRGILVLVENLHVAAAVVAGLRLDGVATAVDPQVADALGGAAERAFDAHVVPQRGAQRAGAEPRTVRPEPADDHG